MMAVTSARPSHTSRVFARRMSLSAKTTGGTTGGGWLGDDRLFAVSAVTLAVLACAVPVIVRSAVGLLAVESTTPIEWVPETFPPRVAYDAFTREFESGDVVVASWPGCRVGEPAVERFVAAATGPDAPCDAAGREWFESAVSGSQALERLRGALVGPAEQTCVVVAFTRAGLVDRRRATAWIRDTLRDTAGVAAADLHLAGPVIDNVAVDHASAETLRVYGGPAALIIFALTWWSLRSFRYALLVFLLSLVCVGLCFTSLAVWGDRMNPVLIVMPLLVLTLGVSGGIHLVNYLVEARAHGPAAGTAWRAIRLGWLPCALSAGTTALGLASLVVSELEPIRVFGFHAAGGVLATLAVLFLVVPGVFARWPVEGGGDADSGAGRTVRFASFTIRRAGPIIALSVAAMAAAAVGVPGIRASVAIDTLFTPETSVIRDYRWLESHIGPLAPVEVVLRFDADSDVRPAERVDIVREVEAALGGIPDVTGVMSAAMFLPDLDGGSGTRTAARKALVARRLESNLAAMADLRVVRTVADGQLWRVTARTSALAGIDYGDFLGTVRARIEPVISAHGGAARG
ncbi:MAG: hypothetical protein EBZ74_12260, partial [Planctomycetia bacterium]|nr:hypothetical protein [Planctomycetia bacterium]